MKNKSLTLTAAFLLLIGLSGLHAQQAILSASNNAFGNNGQVSYSVGQVAFITCTGIDGNSTEGVQQPYEILFMEGIDNEYGITLKSVVFPNPANAYITLTIENQKGLDLSCRLGSLNGSLLKSMKISGNETKIPMDDLAPDAYILTVFEKGQAVQTYKIIKK